MYALLALLAALSAWALLAWLSGARPSLAWMAAYTLLLAAGLYTHYFFPAVIVAQGAVVLLATIGKRKTRNTKYEIRQGSDNSYLVSRISYLEWLRPLAVWVGMAAVATLLYAPWIPVFLRQIGGRGEAAGLAEFAAESARWLALGSTVAPDEALWAVVAFVALATLGAVAGGRRSATPLALADTEFATDVEAHLGHPPVEPRTRAQRDHPHAGTFVGHAQRKVCPARHIHDRPPRMRSRAAGQASDRLAIFTWTLCRKPSSLTARSLKRPGKSLPAWAMFRLIRGISRLCPDSIDSLD